MSQKLRCDRRKIGSAGLDARAFAPVRIACVGTATATALREHGLRADDVPPERHTSGALAAHLIARGVSGQRVLLPQSELARDVLSRELTAAGAAVEALPVYRTVAPRDSDPSLLDLVRAGQIDVATFASPSAVRNLADMLGGDDALARGLADSLVGCIGPVTAKAATSHGLHVGVVPQTSTMDNLIRALIDALAS